MLEKVTEVLSSKKLIVVLGFLGLFLLSTGTSWAVFSYLVKPQTTSLTTDGSSLEQSRSKISLELPKEEECPINGEKYTKAEKDIWSQRRPIATMVENHADSRPPSGLSRADVIYEAVAEGGITRFLAIFYCGAAAEDIKVAPVRSARVYFIDWASEYGDKPIFMHVGGANDYSGFGDTAREARALELLQTLGWRVSKGNDFDTTYDSGFPIFWRNYERLGRPVATEHTMMASLDAAYEEAQKRGFSAKDEDGVAWDESYVKWRFADGAPNQTPDAGKISFGFWSNKPEYDVEWNYDSSQNRYLRKNGGQEHKDLDTDSQLSAKNVVIMFVRERGPVDNNKHLLYTTIGEGRALIFTNGTVIEGTWEKDSRQSRSKFLNKSGAEVAFTRGTIWIEAIPLGKEVEY